MWPWLEPSADEPLVEEGPGVLGQQRSPLLAHQPAVLVGEARLQVGGVQALVQVERVGARVVRAEHLCRARRVLGRYWEGTRKVLRAEHLCHARKVL